jgi:hypothetical protein
MKNQSLLVIFLVVVAATYCHTLPDEKINKYQNEVENDNVIKSIKPDPKVPKALDTRFNKMLPLPKLNDNQLEMASTAEKVQKNQRASTTEKSAPKLDTSTIGKYLK